MTRRTESLIRSFVYLLILLAFVVLAANMAGCSTEADAQSTPATIVSPPSVSLGPDQDARKHNTPALMAALKRYLNAHNALREEMTSYKDEMDVDYGRAHLILEELRLSVIALDEEIKNFDKATAKGGRHAESVGISRNRYVE